MRKTKKLIALVLALVFVVAFMAMNVSAATTRGPACLYCRSTNTTTYTQTANLGQITVSSCPKVQGYHLHSRHEDQTVLKCNNCKTTYVTSSSGEYVVCRG